MLLRPLRPAATPLRGSEAAHHAAARHARKIERVAARLRSHPADRPLSLRKKAVSHQVPKPRDRKYGDDKLDLTWKNSPSGDPIFGKIETLLQAISEAMGARYIPFPLWSGFLQKKIIVVHPLGGCPIGKTNRDGVVDEFGRLFDGKKPDSTDVLPGIYVVDGSTIPGPLAANPTLTIAAQAIKAVTAALQGVPAARGAPG